MQLIALVVATCLTVSSLAFYCRASVFQVIRHSHILVQHGILSEFFQFLEVTPPLKAHSSEFL